MKMKPSAKILAVSAMLLTIAMADRAWAKVGGLHGIITSVGGNSFVMALNGKTTGTGTTVFCDANTKFVQNGAPADPSEIKVGVKVAIAGAAIGPYQLRAIQVTIEGTATTKPSK